MLKEKKEKEEEREKGEKKKVQRKEEEKEERKKIRGKEKKEKKVLLHNLSSLCMFVCSKEEILEAKLACFFIFRT